MPKTDTYGTNPLPSERGHEDGGHWLTISDMMTGLMVIFLFVALLYMIDAQDDKRKVIEVAQTHQRLHVDLYLDLREEFEADLSQWSARIDSTSLSVTFTEPDVLFLQNSATIRPRFQEILESFFPRYVSILYGDKYRESIAEVRIEGHTSSEWQTGTSDIDAYFLNMELSQSRTRTVLSQVLSLVHDTEKREWLRSHFTANGLSSSQLVFENGAENPARSRRVEFRVRTDAEAKIARILQVGS